MILDNYKKMLAMIALPNHNTPLGTAAAKTVRAYNVNGTEVALMPTSRANYAFPMNTTARVYLSTDGGGSSYMNVTIGSGTTPPTASDYKLDNVLKSGFTGTISISMETDVETNKLKYNITASVTNTSSSENLTIGEVGLVATVAHFTYKDNPTSTSTGTTSILITRDVFDSPLVIPPSGSATIVLSLISPY